MKTFDVIPLDKVYERIMSFLQFDDDNKFYFLQIIQRRKDNPSLRSNNRIIKDYYINNKEYLEQHWEEIKKLCDIFNARAMLRLNRRDYTIVAFKMLSKAIIYVQNGTSHAIRKAYDRACGICCNESSRIWIVDLDTKNPSDLTSVAERINTTPPKRDKIVAILETPNGYHLIVEPFDRSKFALTDTLGVIVSQVVPQKVDIHTDNPINLYVPPKIYKI